MIEIPKTVAVALGPDATRDFVSWLENLLENVSTKAQIPISPMVARQKVNVLLLERIGNLLLAGEPELIQVEGGKWAWRVPVDLTFPSRGRLGKVGELEVDAAFGEVRYTDEILAKIEAEAGRLAQQNDVNIE